MNIQEFKSKINFIGCVTLSWARGKNPFHDRTITLFEVPGIPSEDFADPKNIPSDPFTMVHQEGAHHGGRYSNMEGLHLVAPSCMELMVELIGYVEGEKPDLPKSLEGNNVAWYKTQEEIKSVMNMDKFDGALQDWWSYRGQYLFR